MNLYWSWCDLLFESSNKKIKLFLYINTVFFGLLGFLVWYIVHFICLNDLEGMVCFIGYFTVIPGYLGGLLYFMRKD